MTKEKDVEMADTEAAPEAADIPASKPTTPQLDEVLASNLKLIHKAVATKEARLLIGRVLRQTATVRTQFSSETLGKFVEDTLQETSPLRPLLLSAVRDEVRAWVHTRELLITEPWACLPSTCPLLGQSSSKGPARRRDDAGRFIASDVQSLSRTAHPLSG